MVTGRPERSSAGADPTLRVLLVTSGADLTAREFHDLAKASPGWRALLAAPRFTSRQLAAAEHTARHADDLCVIRSMRTSAAWMSVWTSSLGKC